MKKIIFVLIGVFGLGLVLSGCAKNNGTVFSKAWANKELNKGLSEEQVVIGKGVFTSYFAHYLDLRKIQKTKEGIDWLAKSVSFPDRKLLNKPAGYFTGHVDICRPKYGTRFGRKIYGCSYTMVFHPSKYYKKLMGIYTDNGKYTPADRPPYIYNTYTTKHAGIAFKKDKKSGIWKPVAFDFNPYGSPLYK